MTELDRDDWDDEAPTDVDKWLAIYAQDSSLFWSSSIGHIENVLDELIWRVNNSEKAVEFDRWLLQIKNDAWNEGHKAGWTNKEAVINGTGEFTSNPYIKGKQK